MIDKIRNELKIYKTKGENYKRFGPDEDGGYVMVDDISKSDFIISCGIADNDIWPIEENTAWEKDMLEMSAGINMYECADITLDGLTENAKLFRGLVGQDFFLSDMIDQSSKADDYILKVDVEGGEWDLFYKAKTEEIRKFRQIALEFHDILHMINNDFEKIYSVLSKINKTHKIVYINENPWGGASHISGELIPNVIEVLFLRKQDYNFIEVDTPESFLCPAVNYKDNVVPFYRYG